MYHTCLHCTRDLGTNDIVETLPIGRRIAFDAGKGRLWVVCRSCGKWNLVPFDNRLEAIDVCARLFHDTMTRFSTDNIGLARMADGLELVRIGEPQRPEFASWRYGTQYKRRRRRNIALGSTGMLVSSATTFAVGQAFPGSSILLGAGIFGAASFLAPTAWERLVRARQNVVTTVPGRAGVVTIDAENAASAHLTLLDGELTVAWSPGIVAAIRKRHLELSGPPARMLTRRLLGLLNRRVGSMKELNGAVDRLEAGGIDQWLGRMSRESVGFLTLSMTARLREANALYFPWLSGTGKAYSNPGFAPRSFMLKALPNHDRLAIEMWLSEEDEARALAGELALLERQWKEAEELAAIADGLSLGEQ